MMGFLQAPGNLHTNLEQGIADLSTPSPIQAQLHILEALRVRLPVGNYRVCAGPETEITNPKVIQRRNQILAGTDPVLMDAYGCITFFDSLPEELPHLMRAFENGVGLIDFQTALQDGRMKSISVGSSMPTVSPATATISPPEEQVLTLQPPAGSPDNFATTKPLPTATALPDEAIQPVGINVNTDSSCSDNVVDPRPFLNTTLIPAAGIVLGAGLVAASRMERRQREQSKAEKDDQNGKED